MYDYEAIVQTIMGKQFAVLVTQKKPWSETRKQKHTTWETPLNIEEEEEVVVEGERDRPPKRAAEEDHIFWEPREKRRAAEVFRGIQQLEPNNSDGDVEHPHPSEVHWAEPETSQPPRGPGANDTSEPEGTPPDSFDGASRRPHDEEKKWIRSLLDLTLPRLLLTISPGV